MKRIIQLMTLFVAIAIVIVSCASPKPQQTIDNLKAAITGETGASANYQAFSANAAESGYYNIAKMFAAASAAEAIHVRNHNAVLVKLDEEEFYPIAATPAVNSMAENLQKAIEGEIYEYTVMYPGFIITAETEKCAEAIRSFTWASEAEEVHAGLYAKALEILMTTENDETVAQEWHVCPKCGNLFDSIEEADECPLCATKVSAFWRF